MAALALLLAVAACSNDDEPGVPSYDTNPNAVRIQPSVSGIVVTRTTPADDNQSTQFNKDDKIKVSRDGTDFYEYTFDGNNWSPASGNTLYLMWGADETEIDLQAYYPVSADMASFTLPQDQSGTAGSGTSEIADADYMTYNGKVKKGANNTASFAMQRRTARIRVTIDGFGDQYDETSSTCDVKICSPHTTVSVNYSGTDPVVTGTGNTQSVTPQNGKGMKKGSIATALIVPSSTEMTNANFMEVTVNNETTPLHVKGIPTHEAGYSYDYHLTVGKDGIVINSVQVNPWNDETVEGGTAEEKSDPEVDKTNHAITTYIAGQIAENPQLITDAIGTDGSLAISGPMNDADIAALKNYLTNNSTATLSLDLTGATLASIPEQAFRGVTGLVSIKLPEGLTSIGTGGYNGTAFSRCTGLQSVTFPSTLEVMEFSSFFDCTSLTTIDLSNTKVATINANLFNGCSSLVSVFFGPNTNNVCNKVFVGCSSLTTIDLSLCEEVPTFSYSTSLAEESPFYGLDMSKITIYVKDAAMKTAFENSAWVSRVGFSASNFVVKSN